MQAQKLNSEEFQVGLLQIRSSVINRRHRITS